MKVSTKLIIGFSAIVILLWVVALFTGNNYRNLFKEAFVKISRVFHQAFQNVSNSTPFANNLYKEINSMFGI